MYPTLQQVHHRLVECESEETPNYIDDLSHTYVVGQLKVMKATTEQAVALGCSGNINVSFRMLKDRGGGLPFYSLFKVCYW